MIILNFILCMIASLAFSSAEFDSYVDVYVKNSSDKPCDVKCFTNIVKKAEALIKQIKKKPDNYQPNEAQKIRAICEDFASTHAGAYCFKEFFSLCESYDDYNVQECMVLIQSNAKEAKENSRIHKIGQFGKKAFNKVTGYEEMKRNRRARKPKISARTAAKWKY